VTHTDEEREIVARQMPEPDPYVAALLRLLDAARVEVGALLRVLDETRASWDREHAASQGIAAERDAARAQVVELRRAGAMLANCAFNLKQRESLDADTRRSLAESQEAWDAAAHAAIDAIPTTPTPAVDAEEVELMREVCALVDRGRDGARLTDALNKLRAYRERGR
jgi:hypothetical protein